MSFFNVVSLAKSYCEHCGARSAELMQCPCHTVHYCSTTCQLDHWAVHKHKCTAARKGQPSLRSCANCAVTSLHLKSCPCGTVLYCSTACQRQHWGVHRRMCSSWVSNIKKPPTTAESGTQTFESSCEVLEEEKKKRGGASISVSVYVDEVTQKQGGGLAFKRGGAHRLSRRSISIVKQKELNDGMEDGEMNDDGAEDYNGAPLKEVAGVPPPPQEEDPVTVSESQRRALLLSQEQNAFSSICYEYTTAVNSKKTADLAEAERKARALIVAEYSTSSRKLSKMVS